MTSDERREVAERLREYDGWAVMLDNCVMEYSVGTWHEVLHAVREQD